VNSGYALRQAPLFSGPSFQCSTTQKGIRDQRLRNKGQRPKTEGKKKVTNLSEADINESRLDENYHVADFFKKG